MSAPLLAGRDFFAFVRARLKDVPADFAEYAEARICEIEDLPPQSRSHARELFDARAAVEYFKLWSQWEPALQRLWQGLNTPNVDAAELEDAEEAVDRIEVEIRTRFGRLSS